MLSKAFGRIGYDLREVNAKSREKGEKEYK